MVTKTAKSLLVGSIFLGICVTSPSLAQQTAQDDTDSFTSENAILDTSILFAIGAREARQELRGSFGWPTFQEGLVEGAYFRFDPDGYARFSPSPRLDADVFEVICRPRTYSCMGRKNGLAVALTSRGTLQLRLENVVESDQFFVADGISELQLPQNILQPLDPRLELLLSSGGELVVKRREAETERISLTGFAAVASYLRWISARQDYVVLPRGWPVPNSKTDDGSVGLTQVANWQSPMPQPLMPQALEGSASTPSQDQISELTETTNEAFELLKEIASPAPVQQSRPVMTNSINDQTTLLSIKMSIEALVDEVRAFRNCSNNPEHHQIRDASDNFASMDEGSQESGDVEKSDVTKPLVSKLNYLIEELGLPADLALAIAQRGQSTSTIIDASGAGVVDHILSDVKQGLKSEEAQLESQKRAGDFKLLSEYFRSTSEE